MTEQKPSQKPRVLVIDDERLVGNLLARFLRSKLDVTVMDDAQKAVELMANETFDIVLTDLRMPGISGVEIIAKASALDNKPPVVVMSGHASTDGTMDEVMAAGAAGFLEKPFRGKAHVQDYLAKILDESRD